MICKDIFGDDRFCRSGDLLLERQREIEQHLRERQRSLFNLERTVLLYDLTNTHFEGVCPRNPKAKRGANKQKRNERQRYLAVYRQQQGFQIVEGREGEAPVYVRVMDDPKPSELNGHGLERIVLCKSEKRGQKEQAIVSNAERRFVDALGKLAVRIEAKRRKARSKIEQVIGRIQARHPRAKKYYTITLEEDAKGIHLRWTRNDALHAQAADLWDCYVLRTDEQTLNAHGLWQLYISLTQAEEGFKALKSYLGLRPNPHHKEKRLDAHVFICVLAYQLLRNIVWRLQQKEEHRNWDTLKRVLRTHCYTTILLPTRNGTTHRMRKAGQPGECQKTNYRNLGIDWCGLPCNRSVIGAKPVRNDNHARNATL